MSTQRQPKGTPVGGQYAAGARPGAEVSLEPAAEEVPLAEREPASIDKDAEDLLIQHARLRGRLDHARGEVHRFALDRRSARTRYTDGEWGLSWDEAVEKARDRAGQLTIPHVVDRMLGEVDKYGAEADDVKAQVDILNEEFSRRPWSRFFAVPDGHVHSSTGCSTCRITTNFSWVTTLSGKSEADAVAELGTRLCSVCFPSAPTEWTVGIQKDESDVCPGSGQAATGEIKAWGRSRYGACSSCGEMIKVRQYTSTVSKHRLKKAK